MINYLFQIFMYAFSHLGILVNLIYIFLACLFVAWTLKFIKDTFGRMR